MTRVSNPPTFRAGLEDVAAGTSDICLIDGRAGRLLYCGYDITDLAEHSCFEEITFLLHHQRLPNRAEFTALDAGLKAGRAVPDEVLSVMRSLPREIHPMAALRTGVSLLGNFDPHAEATGREARVTTALKLVAQVATLVAAWERIRHGREPVSPRTDLGHAANFLYMLTGTEPDSFQSRVLDVGLILHADHELNASTFAGRVTIATLTDIYSAVAAAVGTLKGSLHGGGNALVVKMQAEIGSLANVEPWLKAALARREPIAGFGHRVYRTKDPRAAILERLCEEAGHRDGDSLWLEMTSRIEAVMLREKGLYANVDLYSGLAYQAIGIPTELFASIFAVSRIAGWTAHMLEQLSNNRIIRPRAEYTGPVKLAYVPLAQRS